MNEPMEATEAKITNAEINHDPAMCRFVLGSMVDALNAGPRSRERSLAITKLQEAHMWLGEALRVE